MYFNSHFDISLWDSDADYVIFDDWNDWSRLINYKCFLGAQRQFTITDKYAKKRTVLWGKPTIILSNQEPMFPDPVWIHANCVSVFVNTPFY